MVMPVTVGMTLLRVRVLEACGLPSDGDGDDGKPGTRDKTWRGETAWNSAAPSWAAMGWMDAPATVWGDDAVVAFPVRDEGEALRVVVRDDDGHRRVVCGEGDDADVLGSCVIHLSFLLRRVASGSDGSRSALCLQWFDLDDGCDDPSAPQRGPSASGLDLLRDAGTMFLAQAGLTHAGASGAGAAARGRGSVSPPVSHAHLYDRHAPAQPPAPAPTPAAPAAGAAHAAGGAKGVEGAPADAPPRRCPRPRCRRPSPHFVAFVQGGV
eukprot:gene32281-32372_t